ncbi:MAG: four helix bundle protein [Prevotella sp.]|nr:four helix bundle protein [Prevotella sp.]
MIEFDFSYRKLNVYQLSKKLVTDIYKLIGTFPNTETYALGDQLHRAVISIPSNIAEGTAKASPKEQFHFLEIAYGSLMEIMCQLEISYDLGYIDQVQLRQSEEEIVMIYKMLSSMQSTLKSRMQGNHL